MRRLYVGGLSHTITQKDLRERFGKFGDVEDVELRTRRDDQGVPYKTFGYVNITITDAEFRRCTSVLNNAKWKGGTLQIEAAKESFLDKLAEERQERKVLSEQKQLQQLPDHKQEVLESLKNAGVENFHMKAAVPGTEVPGHEGWVVSKFGRVLPVLELKVRRGNRSKTFSYDPSKHSHNIKRLETPEEPPTPVSMLTWELTGGDDDISKKRRGEFPPSIPWRPKRRRTAASEDPPPGSAHPAADDAAVRPGVSDGSKAPDVPSTPLLNGDSRAGARRAKAVCVLNDDSDSDEEIRRLVKSKRSSQGAVGQEVDDDRMEVVGEDFLVNSVRSRQQQKGVLADEDEEDYDSADTDELLTSKRPGPPPTPHTAWGRRGKEENTGPTEEVQGERLKSLSQEERASGTDSPSSESERDEEEEEDDDEEEDDADSSSDIDTSQGETVQKTPPAAAAGGADGGGETDDDDDSSDDDNEDADRSPDVDTSQGENVQETPAAAAGGADGGGETDDDDDSSDDDNEDADSSPDIDTSQAENVQKSPAAAAGGGGETDDDDDSSDDDDDDDSDEGDSEYEALFSNCTRLEISLADLQQLASDSQTTLPTIPSTTQPGSPPTPSAFSTTQTLAADVSSRSSETLLPSIPCADTKPRAPKKGTTPDEILAAIMVGTSDDDEPKEVKKKKLTSLPAFQGTKKLMEKIESETKEERMNEPRQTALNKTESQNTAVTLRTETSSKPKDTQTSSEPQETSSETEETSSETEETSSETEETSSETEETETSSKLQETKMPSKPQTAQTSSKLQETQMSSKPQETETASSETQHVTNTLPPVTETSSDDSSSEEEERPVRVGEEQDEEKQRQSNLRRLAAMEHRVQLVEQHKKIIQGALGNVDTPAAGKGKHIVFGSDDDDDDEVKQTSVKKKRLGDSQLNDKDSGDEAAASSVKKPSGSKLFDSDDEGGDDDDDEEEDSRFQIKPQFEGRAGQKLMALQSRFGTDQRFQMDSHFLDSDEEEGEEGPGSRKEGEKGDLVEEKNKNLSILSSVLNINLDAPTTTHTPSKTKTFRDVLHYDPSRQEHVAFETKTEEQPKESKASRKKKREEAAKLPEVSTEIYYDISVDLKAAFGPTGHKTDEKSDNRGEGIESLRWDKMEEEEEEEEKEEEQSDEGQRTETDVLMSTYMTDLAAGQQDEGLGFKFSFFSDNAQPESKQETEYSVEALHGPKVSWQTDPRFQDSSSDEEEQHEEEEEESTETTTEPPTPVKKDFFFFCAEDYRLKEGPRLFCRSSELGEQQEAWEEQRHSLIQDYRKKHREARKKGNFTFSHRS